ncbi:DnaJ-domain-containing protein [Artomyces pyxidatus]|uniref:DnaJ-domain-containing protein n=1 Tax=Artomyces pyxidatus TaxID=48021 RepID=A0ACB8SXJ8_9AGAM|nr:DnaJ-domain-containing protein [Artomyces pyxidatus]
MSRPRRCVSTLASSRRSDPTYPTKRLHTPIPTSRPFSTTSTQRATHYETLSIPPNASKSAIKSSYYKLSKEYHPDINKNPGAKERFHAFSEAYSILGDDRRRRAYDRSLTMGDASASQHPQASHHPHHPAYGHPYSQWSYETRRRGATHAWERQGRPGASAHRPPHSPQHRAGQGTHPQRDPFTSPHVRRATGAGQAPRTGWQQTEEDRVGQVSSLWRAAQVTGIVMIVAVFGNGLSASA